jgi:hypothetical protein
MLKKKKIKYPLVKGTIKEILPKIFCAIIDDDYDRSMLFCRYQEFYESPNKKFRGKYFSWSEYMRFYKNNWKKDTFTYPIDWSGYNIPSVVLEKGLNVFHKETEYDEIMSDIYYFCENYPLRFNKPRTDWYLIGASSKDLKTMDHEIAHGLFASNREYKLRMLYQLSLLPERIINKIYEKLIKMGYANDKKILDDEAQAFLSTGLYNGLEIKEIKKYEKPFIDNFKKYKI